MIPGRGMSSRAARPRQPFELESISASWQRALDAAERALRAADISLPASDLQQRQYELVRERHETARQLLRLANAAGVRPEPWLSPVPVTTEMLGLPDDRQGLSVRRRGRADRQRRPARLGVGRGLRRPPPPRGGEDGLALHPVRPGRRLPRVCRRSFEARRNPRIPRQPRNPASRGTSRRPGRGRYRLRLGTAKGTGDGASAAASAV